MTWTGHAKESPAEYASSRSDYGVLERLQRWMSNERFRMTSEHSTKKEVREIAFLSQIVGRSFRLGSLSRELTTWVGQAGFALSLALISTAALAEEADNRALVTSFNSSGYDLFKTFVAAPGNVVFSPYSIGSAMAMVSSGAKGDTAVEMASVLHQQLDHDRTDAANAAVLGILKSYSTPVAALTCPDGMSLTANHCVSVKRPDRGCPDIAYSDGNRCVATPINRRSASLRVANALMLTKDAIASDTYVKRLEHDYAAQVFRNARLEQVNGWVGRMTEGKIDHMIDSLPKRGIVLINAIYFNQAWRMPFTRATTTDSDFHLSTNTAIKVATMHQRGYFAMVSRPGFRAIRLPYHAESLSMMVILPDTVDGATALAQRLDASVLTELSVAFRLRETYADLSLPRFRTGFTTELKSKYQQLGLVRAFDEDRADLSGMTGRPKEEVKTWIDKILHRTTIDVTEVGTEAAAATATSLVEITSAERPRPEPFTVDRPFLFYITDDSTGAILFAGRISDPSKAN